MTEDQTSNRKKLWNAVSMPPESALKEIEGGRLKGFTDIKPQWRYEVMTDQFGPVGVGWKYIISQVWVEPGDDGQVVANAIVNMFVMYEDKWSDPIPGVGGSMLVKKERDGMHTNDEAIKMAVTDALGNAMKYLGVAAEVYYGHWDGSKYITPGGPVNPATSHRFKPGEKDELYTQVRACLENGDAYGLKEVLHPYRDADVRVKVWTLFNSSERDSINKLLEDIS